MSAATRRVLRTVDSLIAFKLLVWSLKLYNVFLDHLHIISYFYASPSYVSSQKLVYYINEA